MFQRVDLSSEHYVPQWFLSEIQELPVFTTHENVDMGVNKTETLGSFCTSQVAGINSKKPWKPCQQVTVKILTKQYPLMIKCQLNFKYSEKHRSRHFHTVKKAKKHFQSIPGYFKTVEVESSVFKN